MGEPGGERLEQARVEQVRVGLSHSPSPRGTKPGPPQWGLQLPQGKVNWGGCGGDGLVQGWVRRGRREARCTSRCATACRRPHLNGRPFAATVLGTGGITKWDLQPTKSRGAGTEAVQVGGNAFGEPAGASRAKGGKTGAAHALCAPHLLHLLSGCHEGGPAARSTHGHVRTHSQDGVEDAGVGLCHRLAQPAVCDVALRERRTGALESCGA